VEAFLILELEELDHRPIERTVTEENQAISALLPDCPNEAFRVGIGEHPRVHLTALASGYAERLIGSIRRECLDHVIVLNDAHLIRILTEYFDYYHSSRPHQSLDGNSPEPRETQMPERGRIVSEPVLGGLHHRYRRAA
jgi:hypothetical protein